MRARRESDLRDTLEHLYRRSEHSTGRDPIVLVRALAAREDREVAGWIASAFAYGRVDQILADVGALLRVLGPSPAAAVAERDFRARDLAFFRHRFHGPQDAADLLFLIGETIRREGSVGRFFANRFDARDGVAGMLTRASTDLLSWRPPGRRGRARFPGAPLRFLLPSPADGSACKRWNLYLRWMVRSDAMDFGLWKSEIPASALIIPTDTHVHRVSRRLGLTKRKSADWKTATEITARLARLDPADPVKYDFAICQLGVLEICRTEPRLSDCPVCPAQRVCPIGRRRIPGVDSLRRAAGLPAHAAESGTGTLVPAGAVS
jgi:uncharacterized protein (TIGR02757 family)